jgi:hypothetical protein
MLFPLAIELTSKGNALAGEYMSIVSYTRSQPQAADAARFEQALAEATHALATPQAFQTWLDEMMTIEEIGEAGCPNHCALAEFLETLTGLFWSIDDETVALLPFSLNCSFPLPDWARQFLAAHNQLAPLGDPVTAGQCLNILATLPSEVTP